MDEYGRTAEPECSYACGAKELGQELIRELKRSREDFEDLNALAIVTDYINSGADLTQKDENGNTALSWAAYNQHAAVVPLLISKGADPDLKNDNGETPLMYAAGGGDPTIVASMLTTAKDLGIENRGGRTAQDYAEKKGNLVVSTMIANAANKTPQQLMGQELIAELRLPGKDCDPQRVADLIGKGADLTQKDASGNTALSWAAYNQHAAVVPLLISKGADPDLKNDNGETPLMYAASGGDPKIVASMLPAAKDLNIQNGAGRTAQAYAEKKGHTSIAQMIANRQEEMMMKAPAVQPIPPTQVSTRTAMTRAPKL